MSTNIPAATLFKASGQIYVDRQGTRLGISEGDPIQPTDTVITGPDATAEVRFADGSTASLSPGTSLEVKSFAFGEGVEPSFILNLAQGTMRSVSGQVVQQNPDAFKIVTPQATVGIRGTELFTAVQPDGQEVHAVLHIGKDHIVTITSNDGQSMVMDQALQAVNMLSGAVGSNMVKHTYKLTEMQQVIDSIAPSQNQQPIRPQGPQGPQVPQGSEGAEGADAAQPAAQSVPTGASQSGMVLIVYELETAGSVEQAVTSTDVGTLISAVEHLQGTLADAGFAVQVGSLDQFGGLQTPTTPLEGVAALPDAASTDDVVSQVIPPLTPNMPGLGDGAGDSAPGIPPMDPGTPPVDPGIPPVDPGTPPVNPPDSGDNGNNGGGIAGDNITVNGPVANKTITGTEGNDTITIKGDYYNSTINGGDGGDVIKVEGGMSGNSVINGGAGNDTISIDGLTQGGTINGDEGDDLITIGIINTDGVVLNGGTGADTINITGSINAGGNGLEIDLGADEVADTLTLNLNTVVGSVNINNYNANDIINFGGGNLPDTDNSVGSAVTYSYENGVFTLTKGSAVINITGDAFGSYTADQIYSMLQGQSAPAIS